LLGTMALTVIRAGQTRCEALVKAMTPNRSIMSTEVRLLVRG
jgi:hypothetical protein